MIYSLLADLVVFIHLLFVIFAVGGEAAILAGAAFRWKWTGNFKFRILHITAVVIVAVQSIIGILCPLTTIEYMLREAAGGNAEWEISFIGRLLQMIIYYDFPGWFFTFLYTGFAFIVIISWIFIPPDRRK